MTKPDIGVLVDEVDCTGCAACCNLCPVDAISMMEDAKGFLCPRIDRSICISCGKCAEGCPILATTEKSRLSPVKSVFAAYSKNEEVRYMSTSGGMFTELATRVLEEGGVVFGAAYDEGNRIVHKSVEDVADLPLLRQSKYAQSDKGRSYLDAKRILATGRTVLFSAAPCEIAALRAVVGSPSNLITVDFLCLGCNSPMVYRKYLESLEKDVGSQAIRVWFKNKELGWNRFSTRIDFANGEKYRKDRHTDGFMRGYIVHPLYVRSCCEACHFKGTPHGSDITLGDFWGVEQVVPGIDVSHGVSIVFVNTQKGSNLFDDIVHRLDCWEVPFENALTPSNMNALLNCVKLDSRSDSFFADLKERGFKYAIKRNASDSMSLRVKGAIRDILFGSR